MHFYYLPSRKTMILWAEKCACTSLVYWIDHNFEELSECTDKPRAYLGKEGYGNYDFSEAKELLLNNVPIDHLIVSHRDPVKRMTSSFVNKFLIRGEQGLVLPEDPQKLQKFSKSFLKTFIALQRKQQDEQDESKTKKRKRKRVNYAKAVNKLSLKKFILTITHPTIDRNDLNGHFAPQLANKKQWNLYNNIVKCSKEVYPLRVESFDEDLKYINQSMGFEDFLPEKKNSTRLPIEEWTFSDQTEASVFTLADLCSKKLVPKSASLKELLTTNSNLRKRFKNTFKFDYQLIQHLNHLSSSR